MPQSQSRGNFIFGSHEDLRLTEVYFQWYTKKMWCRMQFSVSNSSAIRLSPCAGFHSSGICRYGSKYQALLVVYKTESHRDENTHCVIVAAGFSSGLQLCWLLSYEECSFDCWWTLHKQLCMLHIPGMASGHEPNVHSRVGPWEGGTRHFTFWFHICLSANTTTNNYLNTARQFSSGHPVIFNPKPILEYTRDMSCAVSILNDSQF